MNTADSVPARMSRRRWLRYLAASSLAVPAMMQSTRAAEANASQIAPKFHVHHRGIKFKEEIHTLCKALGMGDKAFISVYKWNDDEVKSALIEAAQRGALLKCAVSESDNKKDRDKLLKWAEGFRKQMPEGSVDITMLQRRRKNHSKWAAFQIRGRVSIIHSSCNLTTNDFAKGQNTVRVDCGDGGDATKVWTTHCDNYQAVVENKSPSQAHLDFGNFGLRWFPRTADSDYVASTLNNVLGKNAVVRVMMARWPDASDGKPGRSAIISALQKLAKSKHDVMVLLREDDIQDGANNGVGRSTLTELRESGAQVRTIKTSKHNYHQKWWSIKGQYEGEEGKRYIVFSGSHNFTRAALRSNFENVIRTDDRDVYRSFSNSFSDAWKKGE